MPNRLSRRKLAIYIVDKLEKGEQPSQALKEVAAYLIGSRRTREIDLMVRDVEDELALRGIVVADVMSALSYDRVKAADRAVNRGKKLTVTRNGRHWRTRWYAY